jgi:hypothetical protein
VDDGNAASSPTLLSLTLGLTTRRRGPIARSELTPNPTRG